MDNKVKLGDITREYLDGMSIYEIRTLAREVGVPHPTSLKKQEMIDCIIDIRDGKAAPQVAKRAGRPPKTNAIPIDAKDATKQDKKSDKSVKEEKKESAAEEKKPSESTSREEDPKRPFAARKRPVDRPFSTGFNYTTSDIRTRQFDHLADRGDRPFERFDRSPEKLFESEYDEAFLSTCEIRSGILEILPDGYGFLRANNFRNSSRDSYVSTQRIKRCSLRAGDMIKAYCKSAAEGKPPAVVAITEVNGKPVEKAAGRPKFDDLVPIFPDHKLRLEIPNVRNELAARAIDLIAPIGKGQRAMVVSPPKAGKTTLLKMIAHSISVNSPEVKLMVLLIDERPEEVTDMQRSIKGEVIYSTFDEESDNHIKVAELVLNRAKRLVEDGQDVVILLDSLTRLARANNVVVPSSGKTLSGGVDPVSLYFPKRFFGAARNIENGGSLTIIATALIDTGSRMDDVVYEEFKGTGNMEIHLDRKLSEKRIFPAIDLNRSGTRREELLLTQKELEGAYLIRKLLSAGDNQEAAESIINLMQKTPNNEELIKQLNLQVLAMQKDGYRC